MKRDPLWLMVAKAETEATKCNHDCDHYREVEQSEACGDGFASFSWWECTLGENKQDLPGDCPTVRMELEDQLADETVN